MSVERFGVYDSSFKKIDLLRLNVKAYDFEVEPLDPQHQREEADGANGTNTLGTTFAGRALRGSFYIQAYDKYDYYLIVSDLYKLLNGKEFLYLVDYRQPGKRWARVKVNSKYSVERLNPRTGTISIDFMSDLAFSESIGDTTTPFTYDADVWQYGQGLPEDVDDDDIYYETSLRDFNIWNAGDVEIDPRELPLTIEVTAAQTSSNITLSITNQTNGISWTYTGSTVMGQKIILENTKAEIGGASVGLKTNFGLLNLVPGWNVFSRNSGISKVKFKFRFYYYG